MATIIREAYLNKLTKGIMSLYQLDFDEDAVYISLNRYDTQKLGKMVKEMEYYGPEYIVKYLN